MAGFARRLAIDWCREDDRATVPQQDYIEVLIIGADGIRRKFVGYGELVEVDPSEPQHTQVFVSAYIAPIIDLLSRHEVARWRLGETLAVYTHVHRPHAGVPHQMIAVGAWQGHYIAEQAIEFVLPATKPFTAVADEAADALG